MNVQSKKICLEPDAVSSISDDIKKQGWAFVDGATMAQKFNLDVSSWTSFSSYWETLCLDEHMADQGAYRYRRYSEFELRNGGDLIKLPHSPYEQAKSINSLNGGIAWQFLPLEDGFVAHPFFSNCWREYPGFLTRQ